mmetsp:Transcript_115028/g.321484  ORF Transcript_115028/g.321484 Transcript_115028/m.321484 type:complete len:308 (+) Transcript_115028:190-1113(+)
MPVRRPRPVLICTTCRWIERTMRSTATMSLLLGSPLKRRNPSMNSETPTLPPLSGSKMSERYPKSSGSMSKSARAAMASSSFTTISMTAPGTSTEKISSMESDILPGMECSGEMSIILLMRVQILVFHSRLSAKRARFFDDSSDMAAAMVLSTKMALITLKRPMVITKAKRQQAMLAKAPYSLLMCSKMGVPAEEVQSPKLQRNVVSIDRGTELKNLDAVAPCFLPKVSRKTKLTKYTNNTKNTTDHNKVVMPPTMPCTIASRSLKTSLRNGRKMRANLSKRMSRKSDADGMPSAAFSEPPAKTNIS